MRSSTLVWILVGAAVLIAGYFLFQSNQQTFQPGVGGGPPDLVEQQRMEVRLEPVDEEQFDQSGRGLLEEKDGKVTVTLDVNMVEGLNNQPAHIHAGSCPGVGEILFPLNNVVDGRSVTEIETSLDQLRAAREMALNIHKSAEESSVYTSCGTLPQ
ncbi:CHRD domain-containing protein [Candidatus Daviesbacteria bacterium]|nr:CHRD domain-containing protein [Candidatus Daviesbacteria bacterium]